MELYEAMRCTPATRRFRSEPIPREVLRQVLDAARFAPSGGNRQGWRVIAVEDEDTRRSLRDLYLPHWREYMQRTGAAALLAQAGPALATSARGVRVRRALWRGPLGACTRTPAPPPISQPRR